MNTDELNEHLKRAHGLTKNLQDWSGSIFHAHQHCNEDHKSCDPSNHTAKCNKLDDWFLPTEAAKQNYPDHYQAHRHNVNND